MKLELDSIVLRLISFIKWSTLCLLFISIDVSATMKVNAYNLCRPKNSFWELSEILQLKASWLWLQHFCPEHNIRSIVSSSLYLYQRFKLSINTFSYRRDVFKFTWCTFNVEIINELVDFSWKVNMTRNRRWNSACDRKKLVCENYRWYLHHIYLNSEGCSTKFDGR